MYLLHELLVGLEEGDAGQKSRGRDEHWSDGDGSVDAVLTLAPLPASSLTRAAVTKCCLSPEPSSSLCQVNGMCTVRLSTHESPSPRTTLKDWDSGS